MQTNQIIRKCLSIGISITAVILLTLTSFSNVVGYQTIQTSQQNLITERINQRELLFQTIVDIANNKEIQRLILKSQMSRGIFPISEIPVITKHQIRQMYFLGLILSKVISKSKIQSIVGKYQLINPEIQKEISAVIEKDATLNTEITQLKNSECDCENTAHLWHFPIICSILFIILLLGWKLSDFGAPPIYTITEFIIYFIGLFLIAITGGLGAIFHCDWMYPL